MTPQYALDTNIVSAGFLRDPPAALMDRLASASAAVPMPVWHELRFGAARLPPSRRRSALERYLTESVRLVWPLLAYDRAAAEWHASERARLERAGRSPTFVDGQIAAIAKVNGLILVTDNVSDFDGFAALVVENWLIRR